MSEYKEPRPKRDAPAMAEVEDAMPEDWEFLGTRVSQYEAGAHKAGSVVSVVGRGETPDEAMRSLASILRHGSFSRR
jgi:hypothetical protein